MANPEHLAILKQGVEVWNKWREGNAILPDLSDTNLSYLDLESINLSQTSLENTDLHEAKLVGASLRLAALEGTNLERAKLTGANLSYAAISWSNLSLADFSYANLYRAAFNLVIFNNTNLNSADFSFSLFNKSILVDLDLSDAIGLWRTKHHGPSSIGIDTIIKSKGQIPESFLRGCGLPDEFIDYIPSLLSQPIQYYSCFISYSSKDQEFCERLHADLQDHGVRCWFAPEDLKIGDKIRHAIDLSIRHHDKLMLVLSEQSIASQWVEKEVETAFEKERQHGKTVLFPLMLDRTVFDTAEAWAADIRRTRHIGDFTNWKNHDDYKKAFDRLLRDLKADE